MSSELSDSNIAGPGVVLAFIIAGVLTFSSSFVSLLLQRRSGRKNSLQSLESNIEHHGTLSTDFWAHVVEEFLIQLSDQQLLLGLVVLICAFVKYYRHDLGGNDNLWHAGDVACFSMASHAATVLALRVFFRKNQILAGIRVSLMIVVFALWARIGYLMLYPDGPHHKAPPIVRYFQSAAYIEFFGIPWIYTLTCVPLFISNEALAVGKAISSCDTHILGESLRKWEEKYMSSSQKCYNLVTLLKLLRSFVIELLLRLNEGPKWKMSILSVIFNISFSWVCTAVVISFLWLLTLASLVTSFIASNSGMDWDFGQLLSLAMVLLPLQSFASAIAGAKFS